MLKILAVKIGELCLGNSDTECTAKVINLQEQKTAAGKKCQNSNLCRYFSSKSVSDHLLHSILLQAHFSQICTCWHNAPIIRPNVQYLILLYRALSVDLKEPQRNRLSFRTLSPYLDMTKLWKLQNKSHTYEI